jgi:polysaccharide export outer membrane protein
MKTLRNLFLLAVFAALFAVPAAVRAADAAKPALTSKDANATYQSDNYKLRPTDSIAINVVDDPNATHTYSISIDGTVQLIYLDTAPPLKLADLTVEQAKKAVIKAYVDNQIFIHPSITIDVTAYSTRRINVTGQVGKPGPVYIPAEKDFTLVEAVTEAGGPTEKAAATCNITRVLPDGSKTVLKNVDLYGAYKGTNNDVPLQEGDTIFLGESAFANVWQH